MRKPYFPRDSFKRVTLKSHVIEGLRTQIRWLSVVSILLRSFQLDLVIYITTHLFINTHVVCFYSQARLTKHKWIISPSSNRISIISTEQNKIIDLTGIYFQSTYSQRSTANSCIAPYQMLYSCFVYKSMMRWRIIPGIVSIYIHKQELHNIHRICG